MPNKAWGGWWCQQDPAVFTGLRNINAAASYTCSWLMVIDRVVPACSSGIAAPSNNAGSCIAKAAMPGRVYASNAAASSAESTWNDNVYPGEWG